MANKEELLKTAEELGLEIAEGSTNAQIMEAIKAAEADTIEENEGGEEAETLTPQEEAAANAEADDVEEDEEPATGAERDGTQELESEDTPRKATASAIEQARKTAAKNAKAEAKENA